jgi:Spy/CpxP family protein refolding chaperone
LPPGAIDKLGLSDKQKAEIEKLMKDLHDKQQEAQTKIREAYEKAKKDGDKDAARKAQEQVAALYQSIMKEQQELEKKLMAIFTEEQQKKYEAMRREGRYGPSGGPPMMGYHMFPGQILPPPIQGTLKLTPDQQAKIGKIQKEAEEKVLEVLTDEQKKQLKEMEKRGPGGFGPPGGPPPGAPPGGRP